MWISKNTFDKSLFNEESFTKAIANDIKDGYAVIKIIPQFNRFGKKELDPPIIGVVTEGVEFNIEANYTDMGSLSYIGDVLSLYQNSPTNKALNTGEAIFGLNSQTDVFATQKIYQKSGFLTIRPRIRIVDWNGNGQPILSSLLLAYYCLPSNNWNEISKDIKQAEENVENILKPFKDKINNGINSVENALNQNPVGRQIVNGVEKITNYVEEGVNSFMKLTDNAIDTAYNHIKNNPEYYSQAGNNLNGASNLFKKFSSPVPVRVTIGQYFYKENMLITNVNFSFSKECGENGPLWVDIDLDLTSQTILRGINDVGLKPADVVAGSRVVDYNDDIYLGTDATGIQ